MAHYLPKKTGEYTYDNSILVEHDAGLTVAIIGRSERVMSDVWEHFTYAITYDVATDSFVEKYVNTDYNRTPAYAVVDAPASLMVRYAGWKIEQAAASSAKYIVSCKHNAIAALSTIERGRDVKVVRGRKVPKGTTGRVFWYGQNQFGYSVGIETLTGERLFTAAGNVEVVVDPAAVAAIEEEYAQDLIDDADRFMADKILAEASETAKFAAKAA